MALGSAIFAGKTAGGSGPPPGGISRGLNGLVRVEGVSGDLYGLVHACGTRLFVLNPMVIIDFGFFVDFRHFSDST